MAVYYCCKASYRPIQPAIVIILQLYLLFCKTRNLVDCRPVAC